MNALDVGAGVIVGIVIGMLLSLFLVMSDESKDSYNQDIICTHYFGGQWTDAGCIVDKQVKDIEVK